MIGSGEFPLILSTAGDGAATSTVDAVRLPIHRPSAGRTSPSKQGLAGQAKRYRREHSCAR